MTLLAGPSQLGKTAMIAGWCGRWKDGRSICHHPVTKPTAIGVLVVDRKQDSHKQWFARAGWPDVPMYSYRDDPKTNWDFFLAKDRLKSLLLYGLDQLRQQGCGPGSLIIVDPLSPFIAGNLMDYKQTLVGVAKLDQICSENKITMLGIVHMAKQKGQEKDRYSRPQDRILGSAALGGFTDTQMYMLGPEDTTHGNYELGWIPHNAPEESFAFERTEDGLFQLAGPTAEELETRDAIMLLFPGDNPLRTKEIIAFLPLKAKRTIERMLSQLVQEAKIERISYGVYKRASISPVPSEIQQPL